MSVGLSRIDDDHKVLILILNRLAENLDNESDSSILEQAFRALVCYTEIHFGREESVLSTINYPELTNHQAEHKQFVRDVLEMQIEFNTTHDETEKKKVLDYLKNWLINHILIEDMAYKPFITDNAKAVKASEVFSSIGIWTQR